MLKLNKNKKEQNSNMATTTAPQPTTQNTTSAPAGKYTTERFDVAYGYQTEVDKDGKVVEKDGKPKREAVVITPETAEKLSEKNLFEGSIVTVSVDYPATFDGLIELANKPANDDEGNPREQKDVQNELVKLLVNGAKSKVMNRLRAMLTKTDDNGNLTFKEPADGDVLDLTAEITSGSKRVFLTEEQKMWKSLSFLPQAQKENVWRAYLTGINKAFYIPAE